MSSESRENRTDNIEEIHVHLEENHNILSSRDTSRDLEELSVDTDSTDEAGKLEAMFTRVAADAYSNHIAGSISETAFTAEDFREEYRLTPRQADTLLDLMSNIGILKESQSGVYETGSENSFYDADPDIGVVANGSEIEVYRI